MAYPYDDCDEHSHYCTSCETEWECNKRNCNLPEECGCEDCANEVRLAWLEESEWEKNDERRS